MQPDIILFIFALIGTGLTAGFVAGLFGVGGGVVVVPALYGLFTLNGVDGNTAITVAVGSSLVTLVPTSISSIRAHYMLQNIDFSMAKVIALPMVLGALIGSFIVIEQLGKILLSVFSVVLIIVAIIICYQYGFSKKNIAAGHNDELNKKTNKVHYAFKIFFALLLGCISALSGVGGGALGVPWLMQLGLRIHKAVGTASTFGLLISLPAIISVLLFAPHVEGAPYGTWKVICVPAVLVLAICTVFTAPVGAKVGKRFNERMLKLLFCVFLTIVGLRLIFSAQAM